MKFPEYPIFLTLPLGLYYFDRRHWISTKEDYKRQVEKFDWSPANAPQTTAETDGTILRANEAMRKIKSGENEEVIWMKFS